MKTSELINEIATALSKAQQEIKPAVKDSVNPAFRSRFAGMTSVWESIREPLSKNGLSVCQDVTTEPEGVAVVTRIFHTSGQWLEFGPLIVPLAKRDAHGMGSAASYGRRYSLVGALGVVSDEDDDGQAAQQAAVTETPQRHSAPQAVHTQPQAQEATGSAPLVSEKQSKLLWVKLNKECAPEFKDQVMRSLRQGGISDLKFVPAAMMNPIMEQIAKHLAAPAAQPVQQEFAPADEPSFETGECPF